MTAKIKRPISSREHRHRPKGVSAGAFSKVYWPYLPLILVAGLMLTLNFKSGSFHRAPAPQTVTLASTTSGNNNAYLADTNAQRRAANEQPLGLNGQLQAAAQEKANDMAARNYWSHDTPEGNPPWIFVTAQGYNYQKLGENLAAGFNGPGQVTAAWMASATHKANVLDPSYTEAGYGIAYSPNYTSAGKGPMFVVVAYFGRPAGLPTAPQSGGTSTILTANSLNPSLSNMGPLSTSQVSLGASFLPPGNFASDLVIICLIGAVVVWLSRHSLRAHRAFVHGERYALAHPLVDVLLVATAILAYLLIRTAGFIQ